MAHALGMSVVGEGIETDRQLEALPPWDATKARGSCWPAPARPTSW